MKLPGTGLSVSGGSLALGAVSIVMAPIVIPLVGRLFRGGLKTGIKAGMTAYKETKKTIGQVGESIKGILEEAQAEIK